MKSQIEKLKKELAELEEKEKDIALHLGIMNDVRPGVPKYNKSKPSFIRRIFNKILGLPE